MVIGQKIKEVPTISGMQSAAVQYRLVRVFSSRVLMSNFFKDVIEATTTNPTLLRIVDIVHFETKLS